MKKWSHVVSLIDTKANQIQKQIKLHMPEEKLEDDSVTVDTEILKEKDFIMKKLKFVGKK